MAKNKKKLSAQERFYKFQVEIFTGFCLIVFLIVFLMMSVILKRTSEAMSENVSSLIAANSHQLELNIESYLDKVETTATLLFADESYYLYDATDSSIEDYDRLQAENAIVSRIVDIGLMENFADFGIVYSNEHTVGWISKTTAGMFVDGGMYETFAGCIQNDRTMDGWSFGIMDNTDRVYYVKRLNENAVLVASMYTKELDSVFEYPEELEGMTIRLIRDDSMIIFSSETDEIGETLPSEIATLVGDKDAVTQIDERYLVNVNACDNGWRVVCSMPTDVILRENHDLRRSAISMAIGITILFVLVGILLFRRISIQMGGEVSTLDDKAKYDQLTKVYNKTAFYDEVQARLDQAMQERIIAFAMVDVDNFKQINDRLGHDYGDKVIVRMGRVLRQVLHEDVYIGRMGGDEFALYREYSVKDGMDVEKVKQAASENIKNVMVAFNEEFEKERTSCNISLSIGVCVEEDNLRMKYDKLYVKADQALYVSKRSGKNRMTIYEEDSENAES